MILGAVTRADLEEDRSLFRYVASKRYATVALPQTEDRTELVDEVTEMKVADDPGEDHRP